MEKSYSNKGEYVIIVELGKASKRA